MKRTAVAAVLMLVPFAAIGAIKIEPIPDLRPPREELPPAPERGSRLPWFVGAVAIAAAGLAFLRTGRKPLPSPLSPYETARRAIATMRADSSLATPLSVSAMFRRYAVSAFELPGSGVTAEDVASSLAARRNCPVELASEAWQFLADCDVAKFAPGASGAASVQSLDRAEKLIEAIEAARATAARTL
jgi:hypothetical protein